MIIHHTQDSYHHILPRHFVSTPTFRQSRPPTRADIRQTYSYNRKHNMPTEVTQPLHFRTLLTGHTYLIADFYATWCPPCKQIAPIYAQLSSTHSSGNFAFVKVNVDEAREIAAQYGIQAMPTFLLFKNGKQIEEIKGADPRKLKTVIESASADLKSSGGSASGPKVQEKEKTTDGHVNDKPAQEKKASNDDGLSMLERLMQKNKK